MVEGLHHPIYYYQESHVICTLVGHESSHYGVIYSYLCDEIIPETLTILNVENLFKTALAIPLPLVI